jgi:molecular chaperone GrpE
MSNDHAPGPEPLDHGPEVAPPEGARDFRGEAAGAETTVEDLIALVETLTAERDAAVDARMRLQAEFENYRKRVAKQEAEVTERAAERLVAQLLPTLDAFDAALALGSEGVEPLWQALWPTLERAGLERVAPDGDPFDPNEHEAVMREEGDGGQETAESLRVGYRWKGRVLRPAMVRVRT